MIKPADIVKSRARGGVMVSAPRGNWWYSTINHNRVLELYPLCSPLAVACYAHFWGFAGRKRDMGAMQIGNMDPVVYRDAVNWVARYLWGAQADQHMTEARAIMQELKRANLLTWDTRGHVVYVVNFEHDQASGRKARDAQVKRESRVAAAGGPPYIEEEPSAAHPGVASQADDRGASGQVPAVPGALPEEAPAAPGAALLGPPRAPALPLPPSPASTPTPTRRTAFGFDHDHDHRDQDTTRTTETKGKESQSERDIRPFDSTQRPGRPGPTAGDGGRGSAGSEPIDESDVYALSPMQLIDLACRATGERTYVQRQSFESTMRNYGVQTFAAGLVQYRQAVADGIEPKNAKRSYGMMLIGYVKNNGSRGP